MVKLVMPRPSIMAYISPHRSSRSQRTDQTPFSAGRKGIRAYIRVSLSYRRQRAEVAELVDAQDSGSVGNMPVGAESPSAPATSWCLAQHIPKHCAGHRTQRLQRLKARLEGIPIRSAQTSPTAATNPRGWTRNDTLFTRSNLLISFIVSTLRCASPPAAMNEQTRSSQCTKISCNCSWITLPMLIRRFKR